MTDDRKIITRDTGKGFKLGYLAWDDLPDAPKHTDLEYYEAIAIQDELKLDLQMAEARIKELEAENARMKKDFDSIDWDYERAEPDIHPDPDSTLKEAKR